MGNQTTALANYFPSRQRFGKSVSLSADGTRVSITYGEGVGGGHSRAIGDVLFLI
jgi:hypothetical protein